MTRDECKDKILTILTEDFEFEQPGLDDNLRDDHHGFDSIDAIELLGKLNFCSYRLIQSTPLREVSGKSRPHLYVIFRSSFEPLRFSFCHQCLFPNALARR